MPVIINGQEYKTAPSISYTPESATSSTSSSLAPTPLVAPVTTPIVTENVVNSGGTSSSSSGGIKLITTPDVPSGAQLLPSSTGANLEYISPSNGEAYYYYVPSGPAQEASAGTSMALNSAGILGPQAPSAISTSTNAPSTSILGIQTNQQNKDLTQQYAKEFEAEIQKPSTKAQPTYNIISSSSKYPSAPYSSTSNAPISVPGINFKSQPNIPSNLSLTSQTISSPSATFASTYNANVNAEAAAGYGPIARAIISVPFLGGLTKQEYMYQQIITNPNLPIGERLEAGAGYAAGAASSLTTGLGIGYGVSGGVQIASSLLNPVPYATVGEATGYAGLLAKGIGGAISAVPIALAFGGAQYAIGIGQGLGQNALGANYGTRTIELNAAIGGGEAFGIILGFGAITGIIAPPQGIASGLKENYNQITNIYSYNPTGFTTSMGFSEPTTYLDLLTNPSIPGGLNADQVPYISQLGGSSNGYVSNGEYQVYSQPESVSTLTGAKGVNSLNFAINPSVDISDIDKVYGKSYISLSDLMSGNLNPSTPTLSSANLVPFINTEIVGPAYEVSLRSYAISTLPEEVNGEPVKTNIKEIYTNSVGIIQMGSGESSSIGQFSQSGGGEGDYVKSALLENGKVVELSRGTIPFSTGIITGTTNIEGQASFTGSVKEPNTPGLLDFDLSYRQTPSGSFSISKPSDFVYGGTQIASTVEGSQYVGYTLINGKTVPTNFYISDNPLSESLSNIENAPINPPKYTPYTPLSTPSSTSESISNGAGSGTISTPSSTSESISNGAGSGTISTPSSTSESISNGAGSGTISLQLNSVTNGETSFSDVISAKPIFDVSTTSLGGAGTSLSFGDVGLGVFGSISSINPITTKSSSVNFVPTSLTDTIPSISSIIPIPATTTTPTFIPEIVNIPIVTPSNITTPTTTPTTIPTTITTTTTIPTTITTTITIPTTTTTPPPPPPDFPFLIIKNNKKEKVLKKKAIKGHYISKRQYNPSVTAITLPGLEKTFEKNYVKGLESVEVRPLKNPYAKKKKVKA